MTLNLISDLIPREIADQWLKYLRNEFPTVAFKASTQSQKQNLVSGFLIISHLYDIFLTRTGCSLFCFIKYKACTCSCEALLG